MHARKTHVKRGFTLIEILIVVVILGILAAIIVPQFTNAAQDAGVSSARSQLQTLRSQVELYRVQNNGAVPADGYTGSVNSAGAGPWDALEDADLIRDAPVWPDGFESEYTAAGELTLTFTGATIPDVNNSGAGDAADVTVIESW